MSTSTPRGPLVSGIDPTVRILGEEGLTWPATTIVEPHCSVLLGKDARLIFGERITVYAGCRFRSRSGDLKIGDDVSFGPNCVIYEWRGDAVIGNGTMIAAGVVISGVNHGMDPSAGPYRDQPTQALPVEIGSNVWIGMNSIILPGVTVGDNTIVGAGSVVTRSLPKGVIAYGNPCKTIRNVDENQDTVPGD